MALRRAQVLRVRGVSGEFHERGAAHGAALRTRLPPAVHRGVAGSRQTLLPRVPLAELQEKAAGAGDAEQLW